MAHLTLPSLLEDATWAAAFRARLLASATATGDSTAVSDLLGELTRLSDGLRGLPENGIDGGDRNLDAVARTETQARLLADASGGSPCHPLVAWYAAERAQECRAERVAEQADAVLRGALPAIGVQTDAAVRRLGLPPEQARVRVVRAMTPEEPRLNLGAARELAAWVGRCDRRWQPFADEGVFDDAAAKAVQGFDRAYRLIAEDDAEIVRRRVAADVCLRNGYETPRLRYCAALLDDEILHRFPELLPHLRTPHGLDTSARSLRHAFANRELELSHGDAPAAAPPTVRVYRPVDLTRWRGQS